MADGRRWMAAALALLVPLRAAAEPAITPRPATVVEAAGPAVRLGEGTRLVVAAGDAGGRAAAAELQALLGRSGGPHLPIAAAAGAAPAIRFVRRPGLAPEGYTLDVGASGATVAASTAAGSFYGAVSLWQLMTAAPGGRIAPVHIADAPRFAWRGLMLDSVRHVQSPAEIARMLDWMAVHKLNRLQWHLADDQGWRLEIKRYPRLTSVAAWRTKPPAAGLAPGRYGGFYTQAEVRQIVAEAAARHITVVPEIEMPGHSTAAILAYPAIGLTNLTPANLGDWGIFPSIYGVDAPTFDFLDNILDEVMALFPAHEIAIGGDEAVHTLWHASPAVQARMRALGLEDEDALQGWFVGQIGHHLNAHGRRLVGWDEILSDPTLPTDDIVLSWHGADGAIAAARAGHDVVMATAPTLYFDNRQAPGPAEPPGRGLVVSLADVYAYDPGDPPHSAGTPGLDAAAAAHVLGVQAQLWTEHVPDERQLEAMAFPRAAALAEIGWTQAGRRDWGSFVGRLPAMMTRDRALGIGADEGAVAIQADPVRDGPRVRVTLTRQLALGDIRYTVDGAEPTAASPVYRAPLDLPLPTHLRAAGFADGRPLSRTLDLPLDGVSATHRASQQLTPCTDMVLLNLAGPLAGGRRPAYLVDIKNPCWIDRSADLTGVRHVAVSVAALPFNYQLNEPAPQVLPPTATPAGELVVRRGCDGPVLATATLAGVRRDGQPSTLLADLPAQAGVADLCLTLARPRLDPLWVLGWVELRP